MGTDTARQLIALALREDLGDTGDVTSAAVFGDETASLILRSKDEGVMAGALLFERTFQEVDAGVVVEWSREDGDYLVAGDEVARVRGKSVSLLSAERTALNFLSFLSGISTATQRYVSAAAQHGNAVVLDTRKTLPGYRELSKYAVRMGGGTNHRTGLFDMVMLKDNHIDLSGSISAAVARVREKWGARFRVEVECRTAEDVREALESGVDVIMLDNIGVEEIERILNQPHDGVEMEASGNVSLESIGTFSATGVDLISVGKLTHSVQAFDFSLQYAAEQ